MSGSIIDSGTDPSGTGGSSRSFLISMEIRATSYAIFICFSINSLRFRSLHVSFVSFSISLLPCC